MENRALITRVTVLSTGDPFVREVNTFYVAAAPDSHILVTNTSFGGVPVPRGIIFYSQKLQPVLG
jgi:hypothetical protein